MSELKFIEENYPLTKHGSSNRLIRHTSFRRLKQNYRHIYWD